MVQLTFPSGPAGSPRKPRTLKGAAGFSGSMTAPDSPNSGFSGFSGYSRQTADKPNLGELLDALECRNATLRKLSRLADACLRRLSPEARADAFREVREDEA